MVREGREEASIIPTDYRIERCHEPFYSWVYRSKTLNISEENGIFLHANN